VRERHTRVDYLRKRFIRRASSWRHSAVWRSGAVRELSRRSLQYPIKIAERYDQSTIDDPRSRRRAGRATKRWLVCAAADLGVQQRLDGTPAHVERQGCHAGAENESRRRWR